MYFKVNGSGKAGGSLLETVGGRGLGEAELQLAVTVDSNGTPIKATVIGSGTVNAQLTGKLAGLRASRASSASAPTSAWTST